MAFNYLAAHQRMMVRAVKDRGGDFGALYDISRWHHLTPAESDKLADEAGVVLSIEDRQEIRERWEEAERLDALACGRETRSPESMPVRWVAVNQEKEPVVRQVVVKRAVVPISVERVPSTKDLNEVWERMRKDVYEKLTTPTSPPIKRMDFNRKKT